MLKAYVQRRLEKYVKKYFSKHPDVKLVVVTGSVGKTSTKVAVGTVLSQKYRVRLHKGNHNSELSAPLAILGIDYPTNIRCFRQWLKVFSAARYRIKQPSDVDVVVQELGSDRIGQVPHFGTYLRPDIAVITAVSSEHMEFFMTLDNVAREELAVANFSKLALINRDDIDDQFAKYLTNANVNTYGTSALAEYHYISEDYSLENGHKGKLFAPEVTEPFDANVHILGEHTLRPAVAAMAVGLKLGMSVQEISKAVETIRPLMGRMNVLRGLSGSTIIDDTYNSSSLAAASALRELYKLNVPQRIAVLGSMNELGAMSMVEHAELGKLCERESLAWVVTVGDEAEQYLAPEARKNGCQVRCFKTALQAGGFVHSVLEPGAAVLFKGSQGGIYLEEAVKIILHTSEDEKHLVRQSAEWVRIKTEFFQNNS
jgi:UDP-N-acetylmuramoyl-tripeptide--D-alanyl-D-alanine ligase